jgi:hypothetical protein
LIVTTLLIVRHRWREMYLVDRGIDCTKHDFDEEICAERLRSTEGGRIHHVLINNAIRFIRVKTYCGY